MTYAAPAATRVGHIHLKVSDLERAIAFYSGVLGFGLVTRYGPGAAFLAAGEYHHHIGLNTWESAGARPPPKGHTGLFHTAFVYPDRRSLAEVVQRVIDAGIAIDGMADHSVSEAVYLRDPDENGVELYWDRPRNLWTTQPDGKISIVNKPLDLNNLLAELTH